MQTPDDNIGIPVTDDLSRRAVESLKRGQATPPNTQQLLPFSSAETLTGGDGRVMPRTQSFPQVFLLHPKNLKYVRGESEKPTNSTFNPWIMVLILALSAAAALWIFDLGSFITRQVATIQRIGLDMGALIRNPLIISLGVVALIVVVLGWAWSYNARIMKRLAGDGTLLLGQILITNGRWVSSGSGKNRSRSYKVTVAYRVRLPEGQLVDGQQTATRGDLARKGLPVPGTPVAVLYVSELDKMLL